MQLGFTNEHCGIKRSAHVSEKNGHEIENKKEFIDEWPFHGRKPFRDLTL